MPSVSYTTLTTRIRQRCDLENSTFVTDAEILTHINVSLAELWDLLVAAHPEFYISYQTLTATGSEAGLFALPTDFYGTIGVDYRVNTGQYSALEKIPLSERNRYDYSTTGTATGYTYDHSTAMTTTVFPKLHLLPHPQAGQVYRHVYTICAPTLQVGGPTTFNTINGYEEYIVLDVSIKLAQKEETPTNTWKEDKAAIKERLEAAAELRTVSEVGRIADFDGSSVTEIDPADYWWYTR